MNSIKSFDLSTPGIIKQKINAYSYRFIGMKQLFTILIFYKPYVVWSLIVNICIAIICPAIISAITTKLLLTIFIWLTNVGIVQLVVHSVLEKLN